MLALRLAAHMVSEPAVQRAIADTEDTLLTVADLVALTGFGERTVLRMLKERRIPGSLINGEWRCTRKAYRRAADTGFADTGARVDTRKRKS